MNMDLDQWLRVLQMVVLAASVLVNLFLFVRARSDERFKEFDARLAGLASQKRAMQAELTQVDKRSAVHEAKLASMPTHADLQEIRRELTSLKASTAAIEERSETTLETVQSIQLYLLENK